MKASTRQVTVDLDAAMAALQEQMAHAGAQLVDIATKCELAGRKPVARTLMRAAHSILRAAADNDC